MDLADGFTPASGNGRSAEGLPVLTVVDHQVTGPVVEREVAQHRVGDVLETRQLGRAVAPNSLKREGQHI